MAQISQYKNSKTYDEVDKWHDYITGRISLQPIKPLKKHLKKQQYINKKKKNKRKQKKNGVKKLKGKERDNVKMKLHMKIKSIKRHTLSRKEQIRLRNKEMQEIILSNINYFKYLSLLQ